MTSLYVSEIRSLFSNRKRNVTESFHDATCVHLAGLFEVCNPRNQQQFPGVLSTMIRCEGNDLRLLMHAPSLRVRGEGWDEGASTLLEGHAGRDFTVAPGNVGVRVI